MTKYIQCNHCVFCGEEFRWGELKIMHVMKKHFDKIPYELYKPLVLWYLDHEDKKNSWSNTTMDDGLTNQDVRCSRCARNNHRLTLDGERRE